MYLIDTSVWIDAINNANTLSAALLHSLPSEECALMPIIYNEVLQGANSRQKFDIYKKYLSAQKFYYLRDSKESYAQAAWMYLKCRKYGITIRSNADCLIAQCAIENKLTLLHNDQDFIKIAEVMPNLVQKIT